MGAYALVQYIIYGIEDGHVDMPVTIDFLHAFGAEEAFGNHFHLYLCRLYGVALANHGAKGTVAREVGIARYQQVA